MRRWVLVAALLMAGCVDGTGRDTEPSAEPEHADSPGGSATGPDGAAQGPANGPAAAPPTAPQEWFLHVVRDCEGEPCNCGLDRNYMDRTDSEGDCDGHGNRPFAEPAEGFLLAETWMAEEGSAAWPAGTAMEGRLYLTTDVQSDYDLFLVLATGSIELARTEPLHVTVRDAGLGVAYTAVPFNAVLGEAVPAGAKVRLELHLDFGPAATSYFIGYEGDHASGFVLTPPAA